ncbi:MAG: type II toxin-antitoxin system Phd/YefM family antitoxin [Holophagales bacterium]|nr:type II toxin-antitoxin system Phd/YefM family antitoxin [Holophagales bacterium]
MKVYSYTQARERLAAVLDEAKNEEVIIRRRNGDQFSISLRRPERSPLDVKPVRSRATTDDILEAIRESRERR